MTSIINRHLRAITYWSRKSNFVRDRITREELARACSLSRKRALMRLAHRIASRADSFARPRDHRVRERCVCTSEKCAREIPYLRSIFAPVAPSICRCARYTACSGVGEGECHGKTSSDFGWS
jgi:hypothetical protein